MASDTLENLRWRENKVYTRKFNKSSKKPPNQIPQNETLIPPKEEETREPPSTVVVNGIRDDEKPIASTSSGRKLVNLSSKTRKEIRELRLKLTQELEQVRTLKNRLERSNVSPSRLSATSASRKRLLEDSCHVSAPVLEQNSAVPAERPSPSRLSATSASRKSLLEDSRHVSIPVVEKDSAVPSEHVSIPVEEQHSAGPAEQRSPSRLSATSASRKRLIEDSCHVIIPAVEKDSDVPAEQRSPSRLSAMSASRKRPSEDSCQLSRPVVEKDSDLGEGLEGSAEPPEQHSDSVLSVDSGETENNRLEGYVVPAERHTVSQLSTTSAGRKWPVSDAGQAPAQIENNRLERYGVPAERRAVSQLSTTSAGRKRPAMDTGQLSISVTPGYHPASYSVSEVVEKRTPKENKFYTNSDFLLAKDKFPPAEPLKRSKSGLSKKSNSHKEDSVKRYAQAFKSCGVVLAKLMKHKFGWVFNVPVDAKGLGLHDYHTIIEHPMDLGTVKARLEKGFYKSPEDFAEDVRLTFDNAMVYNPKGQDVHVMAAELSKLFEDRWPSIEAESRWDGRVLERSGSTTNRTAEISPRPAVFKPHVARTPALKKPKAKDLNKRNMTYEEKQKLSHNLQSLPAEKLDSVVQIIKKRTASLSQHEDEIEVDIDSVDNETLWELDRFVTNYKKSLSKYRRKAELASLSRLPQRNKPDSVPSAGRPQQTKPVTTVDKRVGSPLRQTEQQNGDGGRSSSSSSSSSDSSSSSSDSDSDSSSASGSEAGHSP